jgi:hypothetical protein
MKRLTTIHWIGIALLALLLNSCSVAKFLPESEYLYAGSELQLTAPDTIDRDRITGQLEQVLAERQTAKWRVWWHYQNNFLLRWIGQRIGREPVLYEEKVSQQIVRRLEAAAFDNGHFYRRADFTVDTNQRARTITVDYQVRVGTHYRIDSIFYAIRDSAISEHFARARTDRLIAPGDLYSLDQLRAERVRLATYLRERGYYYFDDTDLEFLADTIGNNRGVQLLMKLRDDLPPRHLHPQYLDRVLVVSDFEPIGRSAVRRDTTDYAGLTIACAECPLRPEILDEAITMRAGIRYDPRGHEQTLERLANYNTFRYIGLSYEPVAGSDSLLRLRANLTPNFRRTISGEVGAAYNSGRYFGPEIGINYANRNLFHGAELLNVNADLTYNYFLGNRAASRVPSSGIYGLTVSLDVPRFWLPNRANILPGFRRAGTQIQLGGRLETIDLNLNRFTEEIAAGGLTELGSLLEQDSSATSRVTLTQFTAKYGYNWQRSRTIKNSLYPLDLRFQNPRVSTEELLTLSRNLGLTSEQRSLGRLDRMILFGPSYEIVHDSRLKRLKTHNFFFSQRVSMNFNTVLPVGENRRALERETSQYPQLESDFRYYWVWNRHQTIAARLHAGVAYPFSERAIVPYFDMYTVGGPNSLRGFIPRGIGPGPAPFSDNNLLGQNGYGNVLLETSLEFRQRITELFEVALFADAGNVWVYKTEREPVVGEFRWNNFLSELATNAGIGLRIDLEFLLLRLDVAKPITIPYPRTANATVDDDVNLVLAFGYPF